MAFFLIEHSAWEASLILPIAGICWTVIYGLTSAQGGWMIVPYHAGHCGDTYCHRFCYVDRSNLFVRAVNLVTACELFNVCTLVDEHYHEPFRGLRNDGKTSTAPKLVSAVPIQKYVDECLSSELLTDFAGQLRVEIDNFFAGRPHGQAENGAHSRNTAGLAPTGSVLVRTPCSSTSQQTTRSRRNYRLSNPGEKARFSLAISLLIPNGVPIGNGSVSSLTFNPCRDATFWILVV